jgi:ribonuclease III
VMDHNAWSQKYLEYSFNDVGLLTKALTHKSVAKQNNERLEFVGDSILGMIISMDIYNMRPNEAEGGLTRLRAHMVNGNKLASIAQRLFLGDQIILGQGELKSGSYHRKSILSNCFEAVIGAVYIDGGFGAATDVITRVYLEEFNNLPESDTLKDAKTKLQEHLQKKGGPVPEYLLVSSHGKAHQRSFKVVCSDIMSGKEVNATDTSIKKAEQKAAEAMLNEFIND